MNYPKILLAAQATLTDFAACKRYIIFKMASATSTTFTHVQRVRLLYKTILRIHRGLPIEIKAIGDQVKHNVQFYPLIRN